MNASLIPQPGEGLSAEELARKLSFRAVVESAPGREQEDEEEQKRMAKSYTLSLLLASILRR